MTATVPAELAALPGTPETVLDRGGLDALPASAPPAPWPLVYSAIVWVGRAPRRAADWLPPAVRRAGRPMGAVGGFVRYASTPVGPYDEVFAGVLVAGRGGGLHVPFMAVDSAASVVGGRANWALPKVAAEFEGEREALSARGEGWSVRADARPRGPRVPVVLPAAIVQEWPDGTLRRAGGRIAGGSRLARIRVEVRGSEALRACLPHGTCLGAVVEDAKTELGPATLVSGAA